MNSQDAPAEMNPEAWHPHNKKSLADLLGVSVFVLNKMIEHVKDELGEPTGTFYCIKQVQFMVNKYGIVPKKETKNFKGK